MIGRNYWYTGITIRQVGPVNERFPKGAWTAELKYYDNGFCDTASTEGTLHLRYQVPDIVEGVKTLAEDAAILGLRANAAGGPWIYYYQDGEAENDDFRPDNWAEVCAEVAAAVGFSAVHYQGLHDEEDLPTEGVKAL